ncbi:hypothetical protein L917_17706, partial [Phytophthora nicotianae]
PIHHIPSSHLSKSTLPHSFPSVELQLDVRDSDSGWASFARTRTSQSILDSLGYPSASTHWGSGIFLPDPQWVCKECHSASTAFSCCRASHMR